MKKSLLLLCVVAACLSAAAKDTMKVKVVSSETGRPVGCVSLTVEYPDTIISYQTDRKGKLRFNPSSFPLTMTAHAEGMLDAVVGFMSLPPKAETIRLAPDPTAPAPAARTRADWSSSRPRRLSSTFIVRTPASK